MAGGGDAPHVEGREVMFELRLWKWLFVRKFFATRGPGFWFLHSVRFVLVFGLAATVVAFLVIFLYMMRFVSGIGA